MILTCAVFTVECIVILYRELCVCVHVCLPSVDVELVAMVGIELVLTE